MTIIEINLGNFSSTGNIIKGIQQSARAAGHECRLAFPDTAFNTVTADDDLLIGSRFFGKTIARVELVTGFHGCFSAFATLKLLRKLNKIKPTIVNLHNIHGSYIDLPLLFRYIKKKNIPIVWTLHDCWSFTGHCSYFDIVKCDKWKNGCYACPQHLEYPKSLFDNSKFMYKLKKKWFTGVKNMTLVTPSEWLAGLVKQSFLKAYPVRVINNGIDLSVFKPTPSDFRRKCGAENKYIVLGVAFGWERRKGLDVFIELAHRLDPEKYRIVLVGTDDTVDEQLPECIISVHRTHDRSELAEIYTAADVFVNPTREENYPTVNMESLACGTPVLTFLTGGSFEIPNDTCGCAVEKGDIDSTEKEIIRICEKKPYSSDSCVERAKQFDRNARFNEYITLYGELTK